MGQPIGNTHPSGSNAGEHVFTTRSLLIILIAGGTSTLAGLVAGYSSAASGQPIEIAVSAGLVAFALTGCTVLHTLHRLIRP